MGTRQTFKTTDKVVLYVEDTPGAGLTNLIKNPPDPDVMSAWGWVTPVNGQTLSVESPPLSQSGTWLQFNPVTSVANHIYTEDWEQAAGEWAAARLVHAVFTGVANMYIRLRFEWIDATGAVFASSTESSYYLGSSVAGGTVRTLAAQQAPANTIRGRLRIDFYGNTSGAVPGSGSNFFKEVTAAKASTSGALTGLGYISPVVNSTNVLGATHTITVNRSELNVGTLTAEILDAAYDPALSTLIRPGKRVKLLALDNDAAAYKELFVGTISRGTTEYDPARTDAKRTRISLTAVDAAAQLSQVIRPDGVATIQLLPWILQGARVPFQLNGVGSAGASALTYVTNNPDANALDQVAITRDSELGYAYVDRRGRLQLWEPAALPTTPVTTLSESKYSGVNVDYDTGRVVNVVNVKLRTTDAATGETVEVPYGPYVDQASVDQWGPHAATFTVQGLTNSDAAASAYAATVLTANATPAVRINSVDLPIRDATDIVAGKAFLDLYDLVTVANTAAGISQNMRITALEHRIEDGKWMMHLDFTVDASVAPPTKAAAQRARPVEGTSWLRPGDTGGPTWGTSWADYDSTSYELVAVQKIGPTVKGRGVAKRTAGSSAVLFTLASGTRPNRSTLRWARVNAAIGDLFIATDGTVSLSLGTYANGQPVAFEFEFDTDQP